MDTNVTNKPEESKVQPPSEKKRILLVDDEKSILSSLQQLLSIHYKDYLIGTAQSAEEALLILRSARVNVLVTDFKLPQMNGLELAKSLQVFSPKTSSILMTAYGNDSVMLEAHQHGCVGYLQKPLDTDLLLEFIDRALLPKNRFRLELTDTTLADIVHFYDLRKDSVALHIEDETTSGILVIDRGIIRHAQCQDLTGTSALTRLLDCNDAVISSVNCQLPSQRTLSVTWLVLSAALELGSSAERIKLLESGAPVTETPRKYAETVEDDTAAEDCSIADLIKDFKQNTAKYRGTDVEPSDPGYKKVFPTKQNPFRTPQQRNTDISNRIRPFQGATYSCSPARWVYESVRQRNRIAKLVNSGVEHFREHRLALAEECWKSALQIDPHCKEARENLRVLEQITHKKNKS